MRGEGRCRRGLQLRTDGLPPFVLCCPGDWLLVFKNGNIVGLHCCVGLHFVLLSTVLVSGGQQRESAVHIHASSLPQTRLSSRLPHSIQQSALCCTAVLVIYTF